MPVIGKSLQPLLLSDGHAGWTGQRGMPPPGNDPCAVQKKKTTLPQNYRASALVTPLVLNNRQTGYEVSFGQSQQYTCARCRAESSPPLRPRSAAPGRNRSLQNPDVIVTDAAPPDSTTPANMFSALGTTAARHIRVHRSSPTLTGRPSYAKPCAPRSPCAARAPPAEASAPRRRAATRAPPPPPPARRHSHLCRHAVHLQTPQDTHDARGPETSGARHQLRPATHRVLRNRKRLCEQRVAREVRLHARAQHGRELAVGRHLRQRSERHGAAARHFDALAASLLGQRRQHRRRRRLAAAPVALAAPLRVAPAATAPGLLHCFLQALQRAARRHARAHRFVASSRTRRRMDSRPRVNTSRVSGPTAQPLASSRTAAAASSASTLSTLTSDMPSGEPSRALSRGSAGGRSDTIRRPQRW